MKLLADIGDEIVQNLLDVRRDRFRDGKRFIQLNRTQQMIVPFNDNAWVATDVRRPVAASQMVRF